MLVKTPISLDWTTVERSVTKTDDLSRNPVRANEVTRLHTRLSLSLSKMQAVQESFPAAVFEFFTTVTWTGVIASYLGTGTHGFGFFHSGGSFADNIAALAGFGAAAGLR